MGMAGQAVALLLTEHARDSFIGPVLAYGDQGMNVSYDGVMWMFESLGLEPHRDGTADAPAGHSVIDFARLVKLMGLGQLRTLDVSAYEGADIIADLNAPVPAELIGQFGLILDGGTMEHVFDIRQGMKNTADMLRTGGRAVHMTPSNNYVNHGFVQVSPTLYHDYYVENGFDDVHGIMIVQPRNEIYFTRWNVFNYRHETFGGVNSMVCSGDTRLAVYFSARKTLASTSDRVPTQSYFTRAHDGKDEVPYQFLVTHDAGLPNVQQTIDVASEGALAVHAIVHIGFGSGKPLPDIEVKPY
jgi:hypothetical protein